MYEIDYAADRHARNCGDGAPVKPMKLLLMNRFAIAVLLACVAGAGCSSRTARMDQRDESNPLIRKAIELKKFGDEDAAIALFKKSLDSQPVPAIAHLELAFLLDKPTRDYVRAVFHYQRYLELRPETDKKEMIEERVRMAKLAFASTLIPQQAEGAQRMMAMEKENSALRNENEYLRNEMRDMRVRMDALNAAVASNTVHTIETVHLTQPVAPVPIPKPPPPVTTTTTIINLPPVPPTTVALVRVAPKPPRHHLTPQSTWHVPTPVTTTSTTIAPAPVDDTTPLIARGTGTGRKGAPVKNVHKVRVYIVQKNDSLSRISLKVYGDAGRWRDIMNANSTNMRNDKDLKVGMRLSIPP